MKVTTKCSRCGATHKKSGILKLPSHGPFYMYLDETVGFHLSAAIDVAATMCLECGAIEMTGDIERARELSGV